MPPYPFNIRSLYKEFIKASILSHRNRTSWYFLFIAKKLIIYASLVSLTLVNTRLLFQAAGTCSRLHKSDYLVVSEISFRGYSVPLCVFLFLSAKAALLFSLFFFFRSCLDLWTSCPMPSERSTFRAAPIFSPLTQRVLFGISIARNACSLRDERWVSVDPGVDQRTPVGIHASSSERADPQMNSHARQASACISFLRNVIFILSQTITSQIRELRDETVF